MGVSCSSDQSAPQNGRIPPCQMHRMNPQRNCMTCQQFMRSQNFRNTYREPLAQQYAPRLQQRYPPQVNRQRPPERPPMMRQPLPQRGMGMMHNEGPPVFRPQYIEGSSSQMMRGRSPQVVGRPYSQNIGGRSPQMVETISPQVIPQMQMPPPEAVMPQPQTVSPPQIFKQPQMIPTVKTMPMNMAASQPQVVYQPTTQDVEHVLTLQPINQETCVRNVIYPRTQNMEIVVSQQEVLPIPKVITAPEPPPCSPNILLPEVYRTPQQPINRNFVQQPSANTVNNRYQPRFN